ncbi:hypothetical protein DPSP01_009800 [Paraphaeosphaeria sporulosa]|uniref:Uncharacterized protein n=1 Tax=Paraphaeosphaeria sporulosa TaxID=1460663 RepID=A0A177C8P6_9PLEO|nr:uncharacterized protein CC84DRAFT_1151402 [Paraphaeosphaeria sporulosa]OAG03080.1 hypothetical protein CC84DRAFT_1151402 [Paraphaeosphaeria sporulosa]
MSDKPLRRSPICDRSSERHLFPFFAIVSWVAIMNFVDIQPTSFLDYAWTSPAQAGANGPKSATRTNRKQNRCCDQCRKGKRACDASILEDALLNGNGETPTTFHYSDVFGPLAPCGNCEKTKKTCTFEWLRSQRILQATTPQPNPTPPAKKRRTASKSLQDRKDAIDPTCGQQAPQLSIGSGLGDGASYMPQSEPINVGVTFADFPCGIQFSDSLTSQFQYDYAPTDFVWDDSPLLDLIPPCNVPEQPHNALPIEWDSGNGSSTHTTSPGDAIPNSEESSPSVGSSDDSKSPHEVMRLPRKRRRRGSSATSAISHSSIALTNDLLSSANTAFLADGLLRIYHDSFETHLSCWLTEKTCPYSRDCDVSLPGNCGPDWNRIYHRVFKLDQSPSVRGRLLTMPEDRAASRALNLAIFSFASQWAVPDAKTRARYPFQIDERTGCIRQPHRTSSSQTEFNRSLQLNAWHQARKAVHEASDIESFRVVLAHIVFSLTQKPEDESDHVKFSPGSETTDPLLKAKTDEDVDMKACEDLFSKLDLTMNDDGPPLYLEQGLRLIHSLRSRMTMAGAFGGRRKKKPRCWKHLQTSGLEAADRATVDVLFWLGIMFDTLSSAMHKRPLVVALEDSDLPAIRTMVRDGQSSPGAPIPSDPRAEDLWDDLLFRRQRMRKQRIHVRWPCSEDEAASLLCEAAPIKVLLFRKVTRIQTLLARHAQSDKIETAVHSALEVYEHWQRAYAPFLRDCIEHHEELSERVQSWYVCLAGHWHLATLLLADLIETMDETESGLESRRRDRDSLKFIARFREDNCRSLSDIARCACLQENGILSQTKSGLFSIGQGALLSEPWSDVLVRAFAIAGAVLIESAKAPNVGNLGQDDAFRRAGNCVKALSFLGQRSDKALSAANLLTEELELGVERGDSLFPSAVPGTVACAG